MQWRCSWAAMPDRHCRPCSPAHGSPTACQLWWHGSPSPFGLRAGLANHRRVATPRCPSGWLCHGLLAQTVSHCSRHSRVVRFCAYGAMHTPLTSSPFYVTVARPARPQEVTLRAPLHPVLAAAASVAPLAVSPDGRAIKVTRATNSGKTVARLPTSPTPKPEGKGGSESWNPVVVKEINERH